MSLKSPKILILKLSAIGDVVHTLPALNALRKQYPRAHITWVIEEAASPLIKDHPALDRVLVSKRKTWLRGLRTGQWKTHFRQAREFIRQLRDTRYDMIIDFQAAMKGAVLILLARGKRKIGFGAGMEHQEMSYIVLNERIPMVSMEIHALKRGLMLLEAIGIDSKKIEYKLPISAVTESRIHQMMMAGRDQSLQLPVAINPIAKWETKLWPMDRFAKIADRLIETYGATVFFTGGPEDRAALDDILKQMKYPATNLAGRTSLLELAALYREMACVISTDTGPMHISAAVDTPTIALFGPTAEWRTGPYGEGHHVITSPVNCRPCFKRICDDPRCMQDITVHQVWETLDQLLGATNP